MHLPQGTREQLMLMRNGGLLRFCSKQRLRNHLQYSASTGTYGLEVQRIVYNDTAALAKGTTRNYNCHNDTIALEITICHNDTVGHKVLLIR